MNLQLKINRHPDSILIIYKVQKKDIKFFLLIVKVKVFAEHSTIENLHYMPAKPTVCYTNIYIFFLSTKNSGFHH